jgi:hypothetical protein
MKSYFTDRHQCVEINIKMSIAVHIYPGVLQKNSVPQGSIQSFLYIYIFFVYMSDCSKTIHGIYKQLLLANDTN